MLKPLPIAAPISETDTMPEVSEPSPVVKPPVSLFHGLPTLKATDLAKYSGTTDTPDVSRPTLAQGEDLYARGVADGEHRAAQVYQDTITLLEGLVGSFNNEHEAMKTAIETAHLSVITQCLQLIFPKLAHLSAESQVRDIIRSLGSSVLDGQIEIHANAYTCKNLARLLERTLPSPHEFVMVEDETLGPMAIRAQWAQGGLQLDPEKTALHCLDIIQAAVGDPETISDEDKP